MPAWSSTSVRQLSASELAKLCRAAIKEDLKERMAELLAEAAETGLCICNLRKGQWDYAIHGFYSDLFDDLLPHAIFRRMAAPSPLFSLPRSDTPCRRGKPAGPSCCTRRDVHDYGNYRSIGLLSVIYKLFTRMILNRISRTLGEDSHANKQDFGKDSAGSTTHSIMKLIKVSRAPLRLRFIDLKKAIDSVEAEAAVGALLT
ncbi:unnamed protein product [Heligmosomoides polygyrus]|uniref:Reverse transcriptase domain-containing protein n=1 Tax=Heligmosomoides polygyrus TaxID=6339 RepID=A0A183GQF4_HELPZ|nr:unnamed protein product [Heligmosomoides polygyrus]